MIRLFEQHRIRNVQELDGIWKFKKEESDKTYDLPVPGCWEQHPELLAYRGKGVYTRTVNVLNKGNIRLEFKGVSHTGKIYWDGKYVGQHYNAFTPFCITVKNVLPGTHEISVFVDNSFGAHSALHVPNDYYTYGGITRPVAMEMVHDVFIKNIRFTPAMEGDHWIADIEIIVENLADSSQRCSVECCLMDQEGKQHAGMDNVSGEMEINAGEVKIIHFRQEFKGVNAWSIESPCLYLLQACLMKQGKIEDDLIERVGFRRVEVKGNKILINGNEVFLKGFNRHEDYGDFGCAIPLQMMAKDMDMIQEMGANAVRTCHYPNEERFLDLCDERGILVWEENHARGLSLPDMQNLNFDRQCEDCIREMIENHYNHPSIIIWGILNECASETKEGREKYKQQYKQIKSMDRSRPTTSATCRHFTDISLDLPDIVSFNMYSGWYQDVSVEERNRKEIDWIQSSGGEGKPIIVSELGAAAIYGYRDRSRCKWSEERQADIIEENLHVYMNDPDITGVFIWQFADCRVTEEGGWFATRARCHNNKGVVDEYRRPKMAYDTIKKIFESFKK